MQPPWLGRISHSIPSDGLSVRQSYTRLLKCYAVVCLGPSNTRSCWAGQLLNGHKQYLSKKLAFEAAHFTL